MQTNLLLRYPACALLTMQLRCTPTAATRSGRCFCHWQRSPRSPVGHMAQAITSPNQRHLLSPSQLRCQPPHQRGALTSQQQKAPPFRVVLSHTADHPAISFSVLRFIGGIFTDKCDLLSERTVAYCQGAGAFTGCHHLQRILKIDTAACSKGQIVQVSHRG